MGQLLWTPSRERVKQSNMAAFIDFVNRKYGLKLESYWQLHKWSVDAIPDFWAAMWQFADIRSSRGYDVVVDDLAKFPGAKWFPGAKLNFAENLLKFQDDRPAFVFRGETRKTARMSYAQLYSNVARLAKWLRSQGLQPGDRACAYMPNMIETVVAMLACTSIGAAWASCGSELGPSAVLDRFGQIQPKIMFTSDGYFYGGKPFNILRHAEEIAKAIPSLQE